MAHPFHHAKKSARIFGGTALPYLPIHKWFDQSKEAYASWQHRALRHHSQGIFECERVFGTTIINSEGKEVPVRLIGEQHVRDDLNCIPSLQDWLKNLNHEKWMTRNVQKIETEL
jgi:hypothetical protein